MTRLYIDNKNVYLQDDRGFILDLENHIEIQKYEKRNSLTLNSVINELIIKHEPMFKAVIEDIEDMVKEYNIDYYIYGDVSGVMGDRLAIIYYLNNRKSCMDGMLKLFFGGKQRIEYMISFFEDSRDRRMGFEFYKYFDLSRYFAVIPILEKYFSIENDGVKDRDLIAEFISNITEDLGCYSN
ncbi:hypothetical protein ACPWSR_05430 [Alloiococcus sp. CFN-8]|uniref:hypothetical protein n=1 Tax=Alloiococcus sp. CFN-8 TaxID=3416081 RepID=UPI003CF64456